MKIENHQIARYFKLQDDRFYTTHVLNKHTEIPISNQSETEFEIVFCDGTSYRSSDFSARIIEETRQTLLVHFYRSDVKLNILYTAREDVIAKEVTILQSDKTINYIDVEVLVFSDQEGIYYPKKQDNIKEMADFPGYYVELGQPVYAKTLYLGMEFPMGENRIVDTRYASRYYVGHDITEEKTVWPAIMGAAKNPDKMSIQKAFFLYIEAIAQPSYFRKQYNSWYDHMTEIDEEIIINSFEKISHGFEDHGVQLDAYVVDDGWCDYQSVWEFNKKFPNGLTKVKRLVNGLGASLGLWIGPRGGYNGTEVIMSDWLEEHPEFGSKNKLSNDVNIADFNYLNRMKAKMLEYQKQYDISYWKIDGWLLKPDVSDISGDYAMHTMTPVYEFLIELLKDLRLERGERDCWLNLTSYVNPSPWFLQWVNSLWIQISQDVGFTENAGNDIQRMITYRDSQYEEFLNKRDIQLPLWALYNHEPIYASTAHTWYMDHQMYATVEEFEHYLMFIATRGNAFWEFHYSYTMFDDERWKANARAVKWIEANYSTLKHSQKIGGSPSAFDIYGYHCVNGDTAILSLRNPSDKPATISTLDWDLKDYQKITGDYTQVSDTEIELAPYEILILSK
ncbi:alpha-N-acetylgalactosaminidase [Streptococcus fryi]